MSTPIRLSKEALRFLMNLLYESKKRANPEFHIDGDNNAGAQLAIERISHIKLVITGLESRLRNNTEEAIPLATVPSPYFGFLAFYVVSILQKK